MATISEIADELNRRSQGHPFGELLRIRQRLKGSSRRPPRRVFTSQTIKPEYAFHWGGRAELQFNIGFEPVEQLLSFRHGVAFSLEQNRNLPDPSILWPRIIRFNEFLTIQSEEYTDFRLWYWRGKGRSLDLLPGPISDEMRKNGTFICLGAHYDLSQLDYDVILRDFDRLLPLYEFVQGNADFPAITPRRRGLQFVPGNRPKLAATQGKRTGGIFDIALRHSLLQDTLHRELEAEYGSTNVSSECVTDFGTRVDTVVRVNGEQWYFEIKTGTSARSCIREALAQLMEYAFWPGAEEASRLVIVGEPELDDRSKAYLETLRNRFSLPLEYRQVRIKSV